MACRELTVPMPAIVEIEGDALDVSFDFGDQIGQRIGARVYVESEGACLILPDPTGVRKDGRSPRGEEYNGYAQAILAAAGDLSVRSIRFSVELICPLAFDDFDQTCWGKLETVYPSLPGWLGAGDLPRWFGTDERLGPYLWASVEPPGLHIGGLLELDRFEDWLRGFEERTTDLPHREI